MQFLFVLKLFGKKIMAQELADLLAHHATKEDLAAMAPFFQAGADACVKGDDAATAQAITDMLFTIH